MDPADKTPDARESYNPDNLICRSIRAIRSSHPEVGVICDAAFDPFNSDGHDGLLVDGHVINDESSVEILCRQSVVQAEAGCHVIAPSDMMDGRVGAIRRELDAAGFGGSNYVLCRQICISVLRPLSRCNWPSGALKGDKNSYQMDPANSDEALRETGQDIEEGADMVMVKPGLPYIDIVTRVKQTYGVPTFAYQVSGEYAMLKAAANNGWLDNDKVVFGEPHGL